LLSTTHQILTRLDVFLSGFSSQTTRYFQ